MPPLNLDQERLFVPSGRKRFCPIEHCSVYCGPGTCKCKPCPPWCPFCRERRAKARKRRFVLKTEDVFQFPAYQPRLFFPTRTSPPTQRTETPS